MVYVSHKLDFCGKATKAIRCTYRIKLVFFFCGPIAKQLPFGVILITIEKMRDAETVNNRRNRNALFS